jgi:hypothetical protein
MFRTQGGSSPWCRFPSENFKLFWCNTYYLCKWFDWTGSKYFSVTVSSQHGNAPCGSIKRGEFTDQLSDSQLLKMDSIPWRIKFNATVTSRSSAGTAWLTAKRYKVFPIRDKYRSIKTVTSANLYHSSCCREPGSDSCVLLYQWTDCRFGGVVA